MRIEVKVMEEVRGKFCVTAGLRHGVGSPPPHPNLHVDSV